MPNPPLRRRPCPNPPTGGAGPFAPCPSCRVRAGFTLVELLVVIAIIAILISFLLPAVQQAREAARRTQCVNNLRQFALAIATYYDSQGAFPASGIVTPSAGPYESRSGPQFSWIVQILPQLEQGSLYARFNTDHSVFRQPGNPQAEQFSMLLCPSDGSGGLYFQHAQLTGGKQFAKGNYAAYVSPYHVEFQNRFPGALIGNRRQTMAKLTDGVSNTIMLSEVRARDHAEDQRGAWALPWTGTSLLAFDLHDVRNPVNYAERGYEPNPRGLGVNQPPNNQGPNMDMLYACPDRRHAQLQKLPCNVWTAGTGREYLSAAPRSLHPGGVNVAFADGHLGFLPNVVDNLAMAYLISIHDGAAVSVSQHVR